VIKFLRFLQPEGVSFLASLSLGYSSLTPNRIILRGQNIILLLNINISSRYRGADKSLARPGRKQATETKDFDVHIYYLLS
jgi:hypothetical protein